MLTIQIPTPQDAEDAAAWVTTFIRALPEELRPAVAALATSTPSAAAPVAGSDEESLDETLQRFQANWPRYADRFMQVHEGLVAAGFAPEWRGSRNYVAYVHPKTGRHFVEMNSSTAYFPAQRMVEKVVGARDFVTKSGSVRLDGDDQVQFVLQMASEELA